MTNGKRGTAPCGHPGHHVIANYVQCDQGCDKKKPAPAKPDYVPDFMMLDLADFDDEESTALLCPISTCRSSQITTHPKGSITGKDLHECRACGQNFI